MTPFLGRRWLAGLCAASMGVTSPTWTAKLDPMGESVLGGNAVVTTLAGDTVRATIAVTGGKAGDDMPWHVHFGSCEAHGSIVGIAADYPLLRVRSDGTVNGDARVVARLKEGETYSVNLHRSMADQTVVACGVLHSPDVRSN